MANTRSFKPKPTTEKAPETEETVESAGESKVTNASNESEVKTSGSNEASQESQTANSEHARFESQGYSDQGSESYRQRYSRYEGNGGGGYSNGGGDYNRGGYRSRSNTEDNTRDVPTEDVAGYLDIMPEGHGFLRPKYIPSDMDVYISASQIRRFNLRGGDFVDCYPEAVSKEWFWL